MQTSVTLARLRGELDQLDDQLLALVELRLSLCGAIRDAKGPDGDLMLRPERQKRLVERLQARASSAPPEAIRHIWRELMAHSLQQQVPTRFLLVEGDRSERLLRLLRDRFGSAAPVEHLRSSRDAIETAAREEAIAVVPCELSIDLPFGLSVFGLLRCEEGEPQARLIGRIDRNDQDSREILSRSPTWTPASWRRYPALQMPVYQDLAALSEVERRLASRAPIVELNDIRTLIEKLTQVAKGKGTLIQGGDCVETFSSCAQQSVCAMADLLASMASSVATASEVPVVRIGRIAGQFAKPRTHPTEIVDGIKAPVYRGDAVNDRSASVASRQPDPNRLLRAHEHSANVARWLSDHVPSRSDPVFTSHEALLLNYEQALTAHDEVSGCWWAGSAHMLWIGDRTRDDGGAHVEYARGIANPIGIKCGPTLDPEQLLRLLEVLNPNNIPGKVTLIPRLGSELIGRQLPRLMRTVAREGLNPIWCVDPMHGNTRVLDGIKTRLFDDIVSEVMQFNEIASAEGAWPGGIHLELTPDDVTECVGGTHGVRREDLPLRYESACDPRLNRRQAHELSKIIAAQHGMLRALEIARE